MIIIHRTRAAAIASVGSIALLWGVPAVHAEVPDSPPVFSDSTTFTNDFFPFEAGAFKVFRGKSDGNPITVVDCYSDVTRVFVVGATNVTARLLKEVEFEDGELVEISYNYFAQADDDTIYYFGEVVDNYEDGVVVDHEGSWLVGGPGVDDPPETINATEPTVFMPGIPEIGDEFKPENTPPEIDETVVVLGFGKVKTAAGKFKGALRVKEFHGGETEKKWYARGVGIVLAKGDGEKLELDSSTFRPEEN